MSESLTQTLVFDVQFGAIRGSAQARAAIEEMASGAMGSGTIKGIRSSVGALERDMKRVMASAFKGGLRSEGRELYKVFREGSDAIIKAREQVARIDNQLLIATDRAHRTRLMRDREELRKEIQTRTASVENRVSMLDAQASRQADMLEEASRNAAKTWKQSVEKSGEKFADIVDGALNLDSLDPSAMIKGFGKTFKDQMAPKLTQFGAKNAGKGGMLGGLGKAAKMLGAAGAAIAGAAAAIGALVAIFAAAYGQAKKLNSALLEGTSAADMMHTVSDKGKGLAGTLTQLRDAALGTAYAFRMSGEEVSQMMNQINESGLQINEWKDYAGAAAGSMGEFATVTHQAFVASKAFGTSVSEIGGFTATMFHEMGKGLERVDEGFRMIFAGAQRSSMSTKQFFTSITEASSGMALYNFRLDDTVALLLDMTEVLGEDLASAQSKMQGQYRNMGMEQRIQTVMNAGGSGVTAGIMGADLEAQRKTFEKDLLTPVKGGDKDKAFKIAAALNDLLTDEGGLDTEALGKMSEEQFGDTLYALRHQGQDAMAMQLENMVGLARGAQGGLTNTATNLGSLSRSGELVQQLMEGRTLLGNKGISSFEGLNRQAYENVTGRSGEDFEILQRIDRDLRAEYRAEGGEEKLGKFEKWAVGALGNNDTLDSEAMRAMPVMERIARDHMKETRSVAQTLKNVIARTLEGIYGFVAGIWSKIFGGSARTTAMNQTETAIDESYDAIEKAQDSISASQEILQNQDSTALELTTAKNNIERQELEIAAAQKDIKEYNTLYRELAMGGGGAFVKASALDELRTNPANTYGSTAPDMTPTDALAETVAAAPAARKDFLGKVQALQAKMQIEGKTDLLPNRATQNPDALAAWLETRRVSGELPATSASRYGSKDDEQWRYYPTGGETPWGHKLQVGVNPPGTYNQDWMLADSQEAIDRGHTGGTGYYVRSSGLSDLTDEDQQAILDYIEGGSRETALQSHPVSKDAKAKFLADNPKYDPNAEGYVPDIFYDAAGWDKMFGADNRAGVLDNTIHPHEIGYKPASDEEIRAIEDLADGNDDTADNTADILDVNQYELRELKKILSELEKQQVGAADMAGMSGLSGSVFSKKVQSAEGRQQIVDQIRSYGRAGAFKGTGNEGRWLEAVTQLTDMGLPKADDFIWRKGQGFLKINPNDTVMGYLEGGGPGGGGGGSLVVNINGGDQSVVYETVRRALKSLGK